jgi:hypothetical protein
MRFQPRVGERTRLLLVAGCYAGEDSPSPSDNLSNILASAYHYFPATCRIILQLLLLFWATDKKTRISKWIQYGMVTAKLLIKMLVPGPFEKSFTINKEDIVKNIIKVYLVSIALLLAFSANAWSAPYPVAAGDTITMLSQDTSAEYEGYYQFKPTSGNTVYGTFCLERNEYFSPNNTYTVGTILPYATNGGISGQPGGTPTQDPISDGTKWLFGHFLSKDIQAATGIAENDYALQMAIWALEGELDVSAISGAALTYYTKAVDSGTAGSSYDVMAMNLLDAYGNPAQSQLVGAPVPEPSTFILFGAGLAGIAFLRRRNKK